MDDLYMDKQIAKIKTWGIEEKLKHQYWTYSIYFYMGENLSLVMHSASNAKDLVPNDKYKLLLYFIISLFIILITRHISYIPQKI